VKIPKSSILGDNNHVAAKQQAIPIYISWCFLIWPVVQIYLSL